jgi:hypothetical protein
MGGPWRERGFEPAEWRTPAARVGSAREAASSGLYDRLAGIVIAYVAAVITSVAVMLVILKTGW